MTAKTKKLLQRMRQSQANWKRRDLENLLFGFGFQIRHGGNHDVFSHSELPGIQFVLPRHNSLKKVYIKKAIKLIDKLNE